MQRDFDIKIYNLDGTPVKLVLDAADVKVASDSGVVQEPADMTMTHAVSQSLLMVKADGTNAAENVTRYHLAKKVHAGGVQELKSEEISLIKKASGAVYGPLVYGQVHDWCDADYKPAKVETPQVVAVAASE